MTATLTNRRAETAKIKKALKARFPTYSIKVGHGTGTAWGWLHIEGTVPESDRPQDCQCHLPDLKPPWSRNCRPCSYRLRDIDAEISKIVRENAREVYRYTDDMNYDHEEMIVNFQFQQGA